MAGTTAQKDAGPKLKKAGTAQSKIALATIEQVDSVPEKKKVGRSSLARGIAEQLMLPENHGKWFKVGHGKLTNAYQLRKTLTGMLGDTGTVEIRPLGDNMADVYAKFDDPTG